MNIQPTQNYNISMQGKWNLNSIKQRLAQKVIDAIPAHTAKDSAKKIEDRNKADNWISRPDVNRGIMGVTALITQPAIDGSNPNVDEETRRISKNKRIAQIIAGAGVGIFCVRGPIYKLITKMTNINSNSKFSTALIPKVYMQEILSNEKFLKNYRSALSMILSLGVMCITNFLLDAPLTVFLTNLLNEKKESKHE